MITVSQNIVKKVKEITESIPRQNGRRNWKAYPDKIVEVLLLQRESNVSSSVFFNCVGLPQIFKNFLKDEKIALAFNERLVSGTLKRNDIKVNRFMIVDELDTSLPVVQITLGRNPSVIVNPYSESNKTPPLDSVLISQSTKPREITFSSKTVERRNSSFPTRTDRDLTQNLNSNPNNDDVISSIRRDLENKGVMKPPGISTSTQVPVSSNSERKEPIKSSSLENQPELENSTSPYLSQSFKPWIKIDNAGNLIICKRIQRAVGDSEELRKLLDIPSDYTIEGKIITFVLTRVVLRNSHEHTQIMSQISKNLPEDI